jgi:transposase
MAMKVDSSKLPAEQPMESVPVVYPRACGIDIGSASHYVAVPGGEVKEFSTVTRGLEGIADWLKECGVDIVAMESTGVYWIPAYELLELRGFEVRLVQSRHVKNVAGRKSDVQDAQWLQRLMSFGLLSGAFRPAKEVCALRAISRHRDGLVVDQARYVQRIQKTLTQMNVQLTTHIADVMGQTGQDIIRAIVAGERDPWKLAKLRNYRVHATEAQIAACLQGNWLEEHLFVLGETLRLYDEYQVGIVAADRQLEMQLARLKRFELELPKQKKKGRNKHAPVFDSRQALYAWAGVDLTRIGGIDVSTALRILVEIGCDLSQFKSSKHFANWLGVCPGTRITGGKRISGASKRIPNRVAQALKLAAQGLRNSQCALGAYYRRMAARLGTGKAITATAHKLARLVYAMLTKGEDYVERSEAQYEDQMKDRTLRYLERKAATLGFRLEPNVAV